MKQQNQVTPKAEETLTAKNECVKTAYFTTISEVKELIKLYPTDYLRTYIEVDYSSIGINTKHGFYSPLVHLQLEETEGQFIITFARNILLKQQVGNYLDSLLTRCVYKNTAEANTAVHIEDALSINLYKVDDFRHAKQLLDRGFKDCKKATVEV